MLILSFILLVSIPWYFMNFQCYMNIHVAFKWQFPKNNNIRWVLGVKENLLLEDNAS